MKYAFTYHLLPCLNFVIHKSSGCQQSWQTEVVRTDFFSKKSKAFNVGAIIKIWLPVVLLINTYLLII